MKRVGVREFRDHATRYLAGNEPLTIERHGEPIGYYFPVANGRRNGVVEKERRAKIDKEIDRFEALMKEIFDRTGMTEDDFARYFDLDEPFPEEDAHGSLVAEKADNV